MSTQVILLEKVEKLGQMGDVVKVKPGFARNYLLPQGKALRASKDNIAYFEAQKKALQAESDKNKKDAEKLAKKLDGLKVPLIRAASEAGQLFGSVTSRDIANEAAKESGETITKPMVSINQNFKMIGLFPVNVILHPEVIVEITVNIARSEEEAKVQAKTGKALIAEAEEEKAEEEQPERTKEEAEEMLAEVLEDSALEIEKEKAEEAEEQAKKDAESEKKSAERKAKKEAKAAKVEAEAEESEETAESAEGEDKPEEAADAPEEKAEAEESEEAPAEEEADKKD